MSKNSKEFLPFTCTSSAGEEVIPCQQQVACGGRGVIIHPSARLGVEEGKKYILCLQGNFSAPRRREYLVTALSLSHTDWTRKKNVML